jgi:hypothetical protein
VHSSSIRQNSGHFFASAIASSISCLLADGKSKSRRVTFVLFLTCPKTEYPNNLTVGLGKEKESPPVVRPLGTAFLAHYLFVGLLQLSRRKSDRVFPRQFALEFFQHPLIALQEKFPPYRKGGVSGAIIDTVTHRRFVIEVLLS